VPCQYTALAFYLNYQITYQGGDILAVDPATLKLAAKAATAVLTDEEARRRVIIIAISPL
jgi:hypothetical protein